MAYYQSNAVYQGLEHTGQHPFSWVSGNAWMLVYGDGAAIPRVMVLAHGRSWKPDPTAMRVFETIAGHAALPVARISFDDEDGALIGDVRYADNLAGPAKTISLSALKAEFQSFGLPVRGGACGKSINDASSSAYQNWQRDNLGAITVSDIDLVRIDDNGPVEIVELKRSYYALDEWRPFRNDFTNFNLLGAVAEAADLRFTIAYNHRQKTPFRDDASVLSLFDYPAPNEPQALGHVSFGDFVAGRY
ncbi:hypothetical protein [Burkholderia alba]|uniref:hypothetical protein n=1 Tax=Burkholderia alba TaxID=2683677 RepID=UPI002B056AA4|nr:hypothetical protein [Burkholderia alba]